MIWPLFVYIALFILQRLLNFEGRFGSGAGGGGNSSTSSLSPTIVVRAKSTSQD